jgi:hypothetical protein
MPCRAPTNPPHPFTEPAAYKRMGEPMMPAAKLERERETHPLHSPPNTLLYSISKGTPLSHNPSHDRGVAQPPSPSSSSEFSFSWHSPPPSILLPSSLLHPCLWQLPMRPHPPHAAKAVIPPPCRTAYPPPPPPPQTTSIPGDGYRRCLPPQQPANITLTLGCRRH